MADTAPSKNALSSFVGRRWQNWSRSHSTHIGHLLTPSSESDIIACIHRACHARATIKVLGAGHSLSVIAVPDRGNGWPMSLHHYNRILSVDHTARLVTAQAGCTLKGLSAYLHSIGLAIQLLGSISEQTLGGAIQTGTHATGARYGPFHTQIHSFVLISGRGERMCLSADDPEQADLFHSSVVGLGVMGIVSEVTLRVVPLFMLRELTYGLTWDEMLDLLPQLVHSNDRLKLLYFPFTEHVGVWTANPVDEVPGDTITAASKQPRYLPLPHSPEPNDVFMHADSSSTDSTAASADSSSSSPPSRPVDVAAIRADNTKEYDKGFSQKATRVDIAQRILNTDCGEPGSEYATEASFPFTSARTVLTHWRHLIESRQLPARGNIEIRFVRGDSAWLSPTYLPAERQSATDDALFLFVAVNWVLQPGEGHDGSEGEGYLDVFREQLVGHFDGRMHWGKMGKQPGVDVRRRYEKWEAFRQLRQQNDPDGVLLNDFTRKALLLPTNNASTGKSGE